MRWLRHLCTGSARRHFPEPVLQRITAAIAGGESLHGGQLMFAVESDLPWRALWRGDSPRQRAERAFARLRTWDTADNNGVLLYLLLADHAIEIVADRGYAGKIAPAQWQQVCAQMRQQLAAGGAMEAVVVEAVVQLSALMAAHMPPGPANGPGLPDRPQLL